MTKLDASGMKEGDFAGLSAFQRKFGQVGVKVENGKKYLFMISAETNTPVALQHIPLSQNTVYLKIECDFKNKTDKARFFYSLDGENWIPIGGTLKMEYTLMEHFMGYRFGLFNYATKSVGGYADFDFFRISDKISQHE